MKLKVNRTVKLSQEEVTTILFKVVFDVEYNKETCSADYGYSSWHTLELSVQEEEDFTPEVLFLREVTETPGLEASSFGDMNDLHTLAETDPLPR